MKYIQKQTGKDEIAERLGITPTYLSELEKGRKTNISSSLAKLIEYEFGICEAWLVNGEGEMKPAGGGVQFEKMGSRLRGIRTALQKMQKQDAMPALTPEIVSEFDDLERQLAGIRADRLQFPAFGETGELPEGFILVPRYDVQAAAGGDSIIHSEQVVDSLAFRSSWILELGLKPDALALISARGDSMEPTLHPGDLLLIDLSNSSVREDAIYAIQNDGSLVVKRVQKLFDGSIVIKSDNPEYREQVIDKELLETVRIVGRVVWAGRRL